jgi:DNA-binding NtrC family response regulator
MSAGAEHGNAVASGVAGGREGLDAVIEKKVRPMLDDAMRKYLGMTVSELSADVSDKLKHSPLLEFEIDVDVKFKKAKKQFRKKYLQRLVQLHFGNISQVARLSGMDRRSVHRLVAGLGVRADKFRKELHKQQFYVAGEVKSILEQSTRKYERSLAPERYQAFYKATPVISADIAAELPVEFPTLDQAEHEWERRYLEAAMKAFGPSPVAAARKIGLRYETLRRKLVKHGLA